MPQIPRRVSLVLRALSAIASLALPVRAQPSNDAILAILKDRVDGGRSAGIVAGILDSAGQPRIVAYRPGAAGRPLDGRSVLEIGSITKAFTGVLLADMVLRGEVSLEDPVAKHLPARARIPSRGGREITLLDLATHTSALPRLPANLAPADPANPYADYTVGQMYEFLAGLALTRDIGAQYEYSNLGAGLLGHALALRAGKSYEDLLVERVLQPLAMHDTRITLTPAMRERLAPGHDAAGQPARNWDLPTLAGAGALRSTVHDMLLFVAAMRDTTQGPLARAAALSQRPHRPAGSSNLRIGLGWHILEAMGSTIVWHNGGTGGYHAFLGFDPRSGANVVALATQSAVIDDIGLHVLNPRFPLTPAPVQRTKVAVATEILDRYVGVYELAPSFSITVTREEEGLAVQATGQPRFPIFAESETRFFLEVVDAQITFQVDASGAATALVLHQGGRDTAGRKVQ